ncbi:hypothetical protein [Rhodococcus sp. KRD197]|uniref:hypothetical protein n=1 Tax=Rhodococcus sp. KRD197 TaxID=2729731 RepID=UPI0019CF587B|nr:hypothetical protein [Rhodococcus sp. KRD197]
MAPPDRTTDTDDGTDDWFPKPVVDETVTAAAASGYPTERKLTVLAEHQSADVDSDDDWYDVAVDQPHLGHSAAPADAYGSFDARTAVLRNQRPYSAPQPPAPSSWWRRHRAGVAVTAAIAVLGGSITGAAVLATGLGGEPEPAAPMARGDIVTTTAVPTSAAPAAAGAAAADVTWCKGQADGDPVTEDSDDPGAVAIWRFEKAFYFDRDGAVARAAGAPDAVMASAGRLQEGIDQLEPAIEFCVLADPVDAGVYDVTVVERGPGIDGRISGQRITTTAAQDGTALIAAIVPRPL